MLYVPHRVQRLMHASLVAMCSCVPQLCLMAPPPSSPSAATGGTIPAADLAVLHEQFASVLLRLSACGGHFTAKRPSECTWSTLLYTNQPTPTGPPAASPLTRHPDAPALNWQPVPLVAPAADSPAAAAAAAASSTPPPFLDFPAHQNRIMSLRSVRTPLLHMEAYCEAPADSG